MDQGVISTVKVLYRRILSEKLVELVDSGGILIDFLKQVTILDAIQYLAEAWELISSQLLKNCWRKADLMFREISVGSSDELIESKALAIESELLDVGLSPFPDDDNLSIVDFIFVDNSCMQEENKLGDNARKETRYSILTAIGILKKL